MTASEPRKLSLIQVLALIALLGVVLTIALPRLLDPDRSTDANLEADRIIPLAPARSD